MRFYAYHGVYPEENRLGQTYVVDVEASLDLRPAGQSDRLEETIDYSGLYQLVERVVTGHVYRLVEAVAEAIAGQILSTYPQVREVKVRVTKPHPPIRGHYDGVAVEIKRHRTEEGQAT
jgi:dihydroneopterin aldolase